MELLRIDGREKVTGQARFPSDEPLPGTAYAFLVTSTIARGRIRGFELEGARAVPGLLAILTYREVAGRIRAVPHLMTGGYANSTGLPLGSDEVRYFGQIVAVVVADRFEAAREAALRVRVRYAEEHAAATLGSPGATTVKLSDVQPDSPDPKVGDAVSALAGAAVRVEAEYVTPIQHHNPIELFTTTCAWAGPNLTIYEPTRFIMGVKFGVAKQLGLDPARVRVVAKYLGGHFGSKFALSQHTALIALAARDVGRPVKLVPTREQCFTIANYRPESRHRVSLGAGRAGDLAALVHEAEQVTSRMDNFCLSGTEVTARLYACPNIATQIRLAQVDRNTPGPMRAPPEVPYLFALESAMDELAVALNVDPVELRRRNDTDREPIRNLPYTTRPLLRCFDAAARSFGWSRRDPRPGSHRDGDWLVGWGCASAIRPAQIAAAAVRLRVDSGGRVLVQTAHHEIGNGAKTIVAITAAEALGVPVGQVAVEVGDTLYPPASVSGGSTTTTSLCHAVAQAAQKLRAGKGRDVTVEFLPQGGTEETLEKLRTGRMAMVKGHSGHFAASFGAQFVEVRVHVLTAEVRVSRMVGAFAAGRIVDEITARGQILGGMVWGVSAALHESTELDPRTPRYMNSNLSDYLIPVNADIPAQEVILIEDRDREVNPLGIKGVGELGLIGVNAAIANAVYHATGRRVRRLPIRAEALL